MNKIKITKSKLRPNITKYIGIILLITVNLVFSQQTKWIAIGDLQNWYSEAGCEKETGRTNQIDDQQDGLRWPAFYKAQDNQAQKAMWLGATNLYDPIAGKTFEHKVVHAGPRFTDIKNETIPLEFTLYGKYDHPSVYVDGVPATNMLYLDEVDVIDESIPSDRMLVNKVQTSMGIEMTRKIYAFSHPAHQNYHIVEYIFKNNGCFNGDCSTKHEQTIEGFTPHFQYRYSVSREGAVYDGNWLPQSAAWGHNTMNEVIGENPTTPDGKLDQFYSDGEIMRAGFSWHGYHSGSNFDNIGGPNEPGDGHLGASQFAGIVTLHADKSSTDHTDDINQPSSTWWIMSDDPLTDAGNNQYSAQRNTAEYLLMTQGHPEENQAQQIGRGNANQFSPGGVNNPGGASQGIGYGPYTIAPGDSVRIVIAEAVSGLSREMAYKVGLNWKNNQHTTEFPSNTSVAQEHMLDSYSRTSTEKDGYKNSWVFTGVDSIFQSFKRARENFKSNFTLPEPPKPPSEFTVTSGGDRIALDWSDDAETHPTFDGYRVTRLKFKPDTTVFKYDLDSGNIIDIDESVADVWEFSPGTTQFDDTTPIRGFDYYYYLEVLDNGSLSGGIPLTSSLFFNRTNTAAFLRRPPGETLNDIRVVPNPYNISSWEMQYGVSAPDRLMFLNIPGECTIRIFTERGDLIQTINHTDGSGDEAWNSITSSRQVVSSGLYIAHIETPDGESAIRKFIVVR